MMMLRNLCIIIFSLVLCGPVLAQSQNHIAASLVSETDTPAPGTNFTLALAMKPAKTWHGYWQNPGDAGVGAEFTWTMPAGLQAGAAQYPVPHRLLISGLMNYVYEADYAHLFTISIPKDVKPGTKLPIRLSATWLACTDSVCVPERGEFAIDLIAGDGVANAAAAQDFATWRQHLPRPLGSEARFAVVKDMIRIGIPMPADQDIQQAYFYPLTDGAVDYAVKQELRREGDMLILVTKAKDGASALPAIEGILEIAKDNGLLLRAIPGDVPMGNAVAAGGDTAANDSGNNGFLLSFGGALLGGLLLNIMPCVFPILSLKALSLTKSGVDERAAKRDALAYSGGVILVCMALGGLLLALRAGGSAVGWAFQLQDPRVILLLLLLVGAIALNLAGLFEIGTIEMGGNLAKNSGTSGAFWTGALAAFIATPCTGPFMGVALGAALVLPPLAAMAIFGGLGLGLALPFLLLGFLPALRNRLPKPGAWMAQFRRILSIPMFITALGLAWILGRQAGVDAMAMGLGAMLIITLALWWYGRRQFSGKSHGWLALAPALIAAFVITAIIPRTPAIAKTRTSILAAEPFSKERLAALQAQKRPVFVYFTADWCLTCKVNEKTALERQDVAQAFKSKNIAVLVGDWTRGDAKIGKFLQEQGRSGVPLYLYYAPGKKPQTLPQILTAQQLIALGG